MEVEKIEKEKKAKNAYRKRLSSEELFAFSDEMHMMIVSGVSALEALTLMLEESQDAAEKVLLEQMQDEMYATGSFASAVREAAVFPEYYIHMVEIGEQTGKTDEVLRALANHYERETAIYRAIRSAVSYPLLMVTMMLLIIIVLVTQIMPIFERVFIQLGSSMEGFSGGLLQAGSFLTRYGMVFVILLVLLIVLALCLIKTEGGRARLTALLCRIKSFRAIYDKIMLSRFASGMSMTISSGMDINQALEVAGGLVTSAQLRQKIQKCAAELENTSDIGTAISASGIFTGLYGKMVVLAAKTGNLEQVMEKAAVTYQDEADEEIQGLIAVVEPTLVIVLSIVVGLILMSVMLPLLNIMTSMH